MTRWLPMAVLLCTACAPEAEEPFVLDDPSASIERVCATLDEAARLGGGGDREGGLEAWRRAHAQFELELAPWVEEQRSSTEALKLDYTMGRVRSEMTRRRGRPRDVATAFATALRTLAPVEAAS